MYCDLCGRKLSYNAKYCRYCGRQLKDPLSDTLPLPVIDEAMLLSVRQQVPVFVPWYKNIFPRKTFKNRSKAWQILYDLFSLAGLIAFLYILLTFKTVKEYQILTVVWGSLLAFFIWWKR